MLTDTFNRNHNYLRISLTDVCNFRCTYCMPKEDMTFTPGPNLMQTDEVVALAKIFVQNGVDKIRLTGGEPLMRKDFDNIVSQLSLLGITVTLTTNARLLHHHLQHLIKNNVRSINISLDTLQATKFKSITRRNDFEIVYSNINACLKWGLHVKLNVVLMKGVNDDEIIDFIELTKSFPVHVRFIEFMPFNGNNWDGKNVVTFNDIITLASNHFDIFKLKDEYNDTAKKFKIPGHEGTFAVISTMSQPFCNSCNRLRITADGKMKNCLFSNGEINLLQSLRNGADVVPLIKLCIQQKAKSLGGQFIAEIDNIDAAQIHNRSMIKIGG
jgi:cyclic pyranopterin phosphate synthase